MKKSKKVFLLLLAIIGLVVLTLSATVAFFSYIKEGTTENVIEAGSIKFHYDEINKIGAGISLEDAVPINDNEGKSLSNYFDFKITSDTASHIAIPYIITVKKKDISTLNENAVKVYLEDGDSNNEINLNYYAKLDKYMNRDDERVIYVGKVPTEQTNYEKNFRLRIWIAEKDKNGDLVDYTTGEYNDKSFTITVNVYANSNLLNEEEKELEASTQLLDVEGYVNGEPIELEKVTGQPYEYTAQVPEGTSEIEFEVETEDEFADVRIEKVNSIVYNDETPKIVRLGVRKTFELTPGKNYYKVRVESENKVHIENFYIMINVAKNADATLKSLTVDGCTLNEEFSSENEIYTCTATVGLDTVTINAEPNHVGAIVSGIGEKTLKQGENTYPIIVTAEDGTIKNYVVKIRKPSSDSSLSAISANNCTLTPKFNKNTTTYKCSVLNTTTSTILSATSTDSNATVTGTGEKQLTPNTSNTFEIGVTSEDGLHNTTYTVIVKTVSSDKIGGLYNNSTGALIKTWDALVDEYGIDAETDYTASNYKTNTASPYYVIKNNFSSYSNIKVVLPDSITKVGNYAFYNLTNITHLVISESITSIGTSAFAGTTALTTLTFADGSTTIPTLYYNTSGSGTNRGLYGTVTAINLPSTLTAIPAHAFRGFTKLTTINIPENLTAIPEYAFFGCTSLASFTIPDNITSIGSFAFRQDTKLTTVTIGTGVKSIGAEAFLYRDSGGHAKTYVKKIIFAEGRTTLPQLYYDTSGSTVNTGLYSATEVVLPSTLIEIPMHAFRKFSSLTTINVPDGISRIPYYAFDGCTALTSITLPNSVTAIGDYAFNNSGLTGITIPSSVTTIGSYAFGSSALTNITIPDSVTSIGSHAFYNNITATSLSIGSGLTSIPESAFSNCVALTNVTIPDNITSIGNKAFAAVCVGTTCRSMTMSKITIGTGLKYIGTNAFTTIGWTNTLSYYVKEITFLEGRTTLPQLYYDTSGSTVSTGLPGSVTKVTLPTTLTEIPANAFRGFTKLTTINVPNGIAKISSYAFNGCTALTSITLPDSITTIGDYAFQNSGLTKMPTATGLTTIGSYAFASTKLTSIIIPDTVTTMRTYAFSGIKTATSLSIGTGLTSINEYAFNGCSGLTTATIPANITSIGKAAFGSTTALTTLSFTEGRTSLPALYYYTDGTTVDKGLHTTVTKINLPSTITELPAHVFRGFSKLTTINIPDGITKISSYAFNGCTALASITLPSSVTTIGDYAFQSTGLTSMPTAPGLTSIGNYAFASTKMTSIAIPDTVTTMRTYAFNKVTTATSLSIGSGLTTIDENVFNGCTGLTGVTIPSGITTIGKGAFTGTSKLTTLTFAEGRTTLPALYYYTDGSTLDKGLRTTVTKINLPSTITAIPKYEFRGFTKITSMTIPTNITSIGIQAFDGCTAFTSATFTDPSGWVANNTSLDLSNTSNNATYLKTTYKSYTWTKN